MAQSFIKELLEMAKKVKPGLKQKKPNKSSTSKSAGSKKASMSKNTRKSVSKKSVDKKANPKKIPKKQAAPKKAEKVKVSKKALKAQEAVAAPQVEKVKVAKAVAAVPAEKEGKKRGRKKGASASKAPVSIVPLAATLHPTSESFEKFDITKRSLCRVIGCILPATTLGYSRNCYIKYWKQIKKREEILKQGGLTHYIQEIMDKSPEKVMLAIRQDLLHDEAYAQMIRELDLYGGVDELEHEVSVSPGDDEDDNSMDDMMGDFKKDIGKDDDDF